MHDGSDNITRRCLVAGLLAATLAFALPSAPARAESAGKSGGGGNDGGGNDGGGNDGGGDNDGGGNDGGGNDGGGDNGGGDDGGGDNGGGDNGGGDDGGGDDGGDNGGSSPSKGNDHALNAVQSGAAAPLRDILDVVKKTYGGEVVRVKLSNQGKKLVYNIRILGTDNQLRDILVDAKSRQIISPGIY